MTQVNPYRSRFSKLGIVFCLGLLGAALWGQTPETGELRLAITDSAGHSFAELL